MWLPYCLLLLLTAVDAATKTGQDSSNSIVHDEETPDSFSVIVNEQELLPISADASGDGAVLLLDNNTKTEPDWSTTWPYFNTGCLQWLPINHVYFQLANSFLFLSYLAPAGLYGLIYLRVMLAIGSAFFAIWGWLILCAFDTFAWNAFFTLINVVHVFVLLFSMRPVRFDNQLEEVYKSIFQPLKVSKRQFKKVANCMKRIQALKRGEHFATEKQTRVENLSLLLSGSMLVNENGRTLHVLHPMQFLDSPEWFGVSSDDFFQVSIRACEECRVMLWHRDKLKLILLSDPFLQAVFDHILGRDVVRKLTQMKEKIASPGSNSPFRSVNNSDNEKMASPLINKSCVPVHEHAAETEQLSLLDESLQGKKMQTKGKSGQLRAGNPTASSPTGRYDYSMVQHLDSTDI